MFALKFGAAFVVSMSSFLCSAAGVGFLVDSCVLVSTAAEGGGGGGGGHVRKLVELGFGLAFVGDRLMWVAFLVLVWCVGPFAVVIASLALVWVFYSVDFVGQSQVNIVNL